MLIENADLSGLNTFQVKARARMLAELSSQEDLSGNHELLFSSGMPLLFLGGGSNMLFTRDFPGLAILIRIPGIGIVSESGDGLLVRVGAGVLWRNLVEWAVQRGLWGIENLAGIPGSCGASPVQNIGAYGAELKDVFHSLEAYDVERKLMVGFERPACAFGYRLSVFKNPEMASRMIVTALTLRLSKTPRPRLDYAPLRARLEKTGNTKPGLSDIFEAVISIRKSKLPDPDIIGNAGSFFKNPVIPEARAAELSKKYPEMPVFSAGEGVMKCSAAWLVEKSGWKGFRRGDAGVYEGHALVLVNHGQASGTEILELSSDIRKSVQERFGICLEPEVCIY